MLRSRFHCTLHGAYRDFYESVVSIALGRPFAMHDEDIDVEVSLT